MHKKVLSIIVCIFICFFSFKIDVYAADYSDYRFDITNLDDVLITSMCPGDSTAASSADIDCVITCKNDEDERSNNLADATKCDYDDLCGINGFYLNTFRPINADRIKDLLNS